MSATLKSLRVKKSLLHRMELAARPAEAFDRRHAPVLRHHGQRQTGQDSASFNVHRAGPALSVVAAFLRPRQPYVVPQRVKKRSARVEAKRVRSTVDIERNRRESCQWGWLFSSGGRNRPD